MTLLATPVAAIAQDRNVCLERDGARSLDACGRIIVAGQLAGKDLATIYVVRATLFRSNGSYDRAIDDMTHAIELLTSTASSDIVASAYVTRASFYSLSGDLAKALADYQKAAALDQTNAQAADGVKNIQAQLTSVAPNSVDNQPPQQIAAPNEPLPPEVPIPHDVLRLVETHPFFANAVPVRAGGYSYQGIATAKINGFRGGNSWNSDVSVTWLRRSIIYEQSTQDIETNYGIAVTSKYKTDALEAANGLVSLGYRSSYTNHMANMKSQNGVTSNFLESLDNLQGSPFPMRVGNHFSYDAVYRVVIPKMPNDKITQHEVCEIPREYLARSFHPDIGGAAYLVSCQEKTTHSVNRQLDTISESKTVFFDQLGIAIRVDPQLPPQQVIQTYFKNDTKESARLQSFIMAR
jgi:tetratricopeptide (TPR) repeat protein